MNDLHLDRAERDRWAAAVHEVVGRFLDGLDRAPADGRGTDSGAVAVDPWDDGPPERGADPGELLAHVERLAADAVETAGPRYFAYFPAGGLYAAMLGESLSLALNRYAGVTDMAPSLVRSEQRLVEWFCRQVGLPTGSGGMITTGASVATLAALHTAREHRLGGPDRRATIYLTAHTHLCVAKAARIAGFAAEQVRVVPHDAELRMDVGAAGRMIAEDAAEGRRPFFVVGTGGSTSTGTVDPLDAIADLAAEHRLWFHVDAAYGGGFVLTRRGARALRGSERADSFAFDPHKSLFMPYGTGVLLVRSLTQLRHAHAADGDYLQDLDAVDDVPDPSDLGPELTREHRGLRLWLPLQLHGVAAFREALDERLDLAAWLHDELTQDPLLDVGPTPDLTVVTFASVHGDDATRALVRAVNGTGRAFISSTVVHGRHTARACVLSYRTRPEHVHELAAAIRAAASHV